MLVISDTGPLRYLVELSKIDLLPDLYGAASVATTPQVIDELRLPHFPHNVQNWALSPPAWLQIQSPKIIQFLDRLDEGEASALSLAVERAADLVLIDERDGNAVARSLGLRTYGTLGVLALAGARGKIDFEQTIETLVKNTQFRVASNDLDRARLRFGELCRERNIQRGMK